MTKYILFDFDGTLADTLGTLGIILNSLSTKYGFSRLTEDEMMALKEYSIPEIFKIMQVPLIKLPFMLRDIRKQMRKDISTIHVIPGMDEALIKLREEGFIFGIITSNSRENIDVFIKKNNIDFFDFIRTGVTLFGKEKVIMRFLREKHIPSEEVIYIGDEIRDIEAAKKSSIPVIAVAWGLNSRNRLFRSRPDFLIDDPSAIVDVLLQRNINAAQQL